MAPRPKRPQAKPRRPVKAAARLRAAARKVLEKRVLGRTPIPLKKRRPAEQLFALLDRAHQDSPDEKVRALLHELQVHGEEITAQNEQLKRAQAELEHARDRYAYLYDFAPTGYLSVNRRGVITNVNLAGAALLGQKRSFLDRLPLISAAHPSRRLALRKFLDACWAEPAAAPCTIEIETNHSPTKVLRLTARVQGEGQSARLFTVAVDITEERRLHLERAVGLDRVKALLNRLVSVQEEERRRMARNLHDHLGQQFTALRLTIGSLKDRAVSDLEFGQRLERADRLAEAIDKDVDFLAWELRPPALDDSGLASAVEQYLREWSAVCGIPAEFHDTLPGAGRLPAEVDTQLYRIVQEALQNVRKHSNATSVSVLMEQREAEVILIIEDDGRGFDIDRQQSAKRVPPGMGLLSMNERASLVGGSVQLESSPGKGTSVFVRVPLGNHPVSPS